MIHSYPVSTSGITRFPSEFLLAATAAGPLPVAFAFGKTYVVPLEVVIVIATFLPSAQALAAAAMSVTFSHVEEESALTTSALKDIPLKDIKAASIKVMTLLNKGFFMCALLFLYKTRGLLSPQFFLLYYKEKALSIIPFSCRFLHFFRVKIRFFNGFKK
jgi:hypothetical protein